MIERRLYDGKPDLCPFGCNRQRCRERQRIDVSAIAVKMMLGKPDRVHAEFVAKARLGQRVVDDRAIACRVAALRKKEIAKFHRRIPFALAAWFMARRAKSMP